ncbi:MAG TPA: hypothetical protein VFV34_21240 [Blastocatellia bacterium]|nr:hypothetical protein [Blastocatellia bacterium]
MNRPVPVAQDLSRARYDLEHFLLGGEFELFEDSRPVGSIQPDSCLAEVSFNKLILTCFAEDWSRSWRIVSYELTPACLTLECTRQMGLARSLVELRRGEQQAQTELSRTAFAAELGPLIEANLPGVRVVKSVSARDDHEHLSGIHARLLLRDRSGTIAGIGACNAEQQTHIDGVLGAGLVWQDALRRRGERARRLMIFVPRGRATTIATRMTALAEGVALSLYEVDEVNRTIEPVSAFDQGDLADRLRKAAIRAVWPHDFQLTESLEGLVESVIALDRNAVEANHRGNWIVLSIRGLEFARVSIRQERLYFGLGERHRRLDASSWDDIQRLVADIARRRVADSSEVDDPVYRLQGERWLESAIRRDIAAIDPTLDQRFVYSQVPTYRGEQRTFIDLLTVSRNGRLAVLELKVAEDREFPFQALDYWLRVEWHRKRGDFQKRGCFRGITIADQEPLLFLVAPLFRFHSTSKLLCSLISERVPMFRIGINDDWRREIRVLLRQSLNRGHS